MAALPSTGALRLFCKRKTRDSDLPGFTDLRVAIERRAGLILGNRAMPMDRAQNLAGLASIAVARQSMGEAKWQTMENMRRAAYIHRIVDCMLTGQVARLPDTYRINPV
ncbi:hypothetical protein [Synechococcus sp. GEYO]|uniref:hypothetical protein n=2 Tax=Synechococcus TaxID=1129 RepID=UPI000E0F8DE6|nr:hypothetical protein [Synechococcus sp. GEYO]